MPNIDMSRTRGHHKLRKTKMAFARITAADIAANGIVSGDVLQLLTFPEHVMVTRVFAYSEVAEATATTATADVGIAGGAQFLNDTDLAASADTDDVSTLVPLLVEAGGVLTFTLSWTGSTPAEFVSQVYVEYVEYQQTSGEMADFVG